MNRRQLLAALLAGGTVAASGLWKPTRAIFLPPRGGWPSARIPDTTLGAVEYGRYLPQVGDLVRVNFSLHRVVWMEIAPDGTELLMTDPLSPEDPLSTILERLNNEQKEG
jgi:hypothetical protein